MARSNNSLNCQTFKHAIKCQNRIGIGPMLLASGRNQLRLMMACLQRNKVSRILRFSLQWKDVCFNAKWFARSYDYSPQKYMLWGSLYIRPWTNGRHFADDIFQCSVLNEDYCIFYSNCAKKIGWFGHEFSVGFVVGLYELATSH